MAESLVFAIITKKRLFIAWYPSANSIPPSSSVNKAKKAPVDTNATTTGTVPYVQGSGLERCGRAKTTPDKVASASLFLMRSIIA